MWIPNQATCKQPLCPSSHFHDIIRRIFWPIHLLIGALQGILATRRDFLTGRARDAISSIGGILNAFDAALSGSFRTENPRMVPVIAEHIEVTPGVCGGKPRIAGHRIRVQDVVVWNESQGCSADEIIARFPQLSLSDVYAALAYYHDHRDEIQRDMAEDDSLVAGLQAAIPSKIHPPSNVADGAR